MGLTKRKNMVEGSGKLLNEDDSTYDFTAGFRALALAVAALPALAVTAVARLTSILANGVAILSNGVLILAQVSRGTIDAATGTFATITFPHHEIHDGLMFKADLNTTDLDDEGNNDALHISFITPDTAERGHLVYNLYASGEASFEIVEAPTGGVAGGSGAVILNKDRNSAHPSAMKNTNAGTVAQFTEDATAPTGGTIMHHEELGSGKNKQAGDAREDLEFILKQNTKYSFRMISTVDNVTAQMTLNWYEHTNEV